MAPVEGEAPVVDENSNVNDLTDLEEKIVGQIEYYFGDLNVRRDKFLKESIAKDPEGWVPIDVLLTFNRLKALTTDPKVITAAITKASSDVIELSEDDTKIKRIHPISNLTEEQLHQLHLRTVHFKGFPLDATLDAIKAFASQYGKVEAVEMRKTRLEKTFKGCCMVVYSTVAEAEKAVEGKEIFTDSIPKFLRENKIDYFKRKAEYRKERIAKRKEKRFGGNKAKTESPKKDAGDGSADVVKVEVNAGDGTVIKDENQADQEAGVKTDDKADGTDDKEEKKEGDGQEAGAGDSRKRRHEGGHGGGRGRGRGKRFKKGRRGGYKGNRNKGRN